MKKNELIGQRFGRLTVAEAAESKNGRAMWLCRCDCGRECIVSGTNLKNGHTRSCGCRKENDLTGKRFGRLTVVCRSEKRAPRGERTVPLWECVCDCGNVVYKATDSLTDGGGHMCEQCRGIYATERARENAGFVGGTELTKLRDMSPTAANTSGVRGVYWDKSVNKWRARLRFRGKLMNFGAFEQFEDAVTARKKAEAEYFGAALEESIQSV